MYGWTDRMQCRLDNMEDPYCCTGSNPVYCLECDKMLAEDADWCEDGCAFCNTKCMREWLMREDKEEGEQNV